MLEVTILGFGGWLSNPAFGQSSYLISSGGVNVLLDAGEGTLQKLKACSKTALRNLNLIILSHPHGDHILGIPTILQHALYEGVKVKIGGTEGTLKSLKKLLKDVHGGDFLKAAELIYLPLNGEIDLGIAKLKCFEAIHTVQGISLVLELKGYIIGYSGDTSPNAAFLEGAKGADLLIHEVSAPQNLSEEAHKYGHTSASDFCQILNTAKPKYILPTHYFIYPPEIPSCGFNSAKILTPSVCGKFKL